MPSTTGATAAEAASRGAILTVVVIVYPPDSSCWKNWGASVPPELMTETVAGRTEEVPAFWKRLLPPPPPPLLPPASMNTATRPMPIAAEAARPP